jgi:mRNA interferase RelE/StbE
LRYDVQFKPRAVRDIGRLPSRIQAQVLARIEEMSDDLKGDVKRLTNFTPAAEGHGLWPWMNAPVFGRDVAPLGRRVWCHGLCPWGSTPEYRLRVGDYRVLFEVEERTIVIYRIRHRREAYR